MLPRPSPESGKVSGDDAPDGGRGRKQTEYAAHRRTQRGMEKRLIIMGTEIAVQPGMQTAVPFGELNGKNYGKHPQSKQRSHACKKEQPAA